MFWTDLLLRSSKCNAKFYEQDGGSTKHGPGTEVEPIREMQLFRRYTLRVTTDHITEFDDWLTNVMDS